MVHKPTILVTLVHIDGPLKGQIQELREDEIHIGRLPSCQVLFPRDFRSISREHARILREGNRFKLIDQSSNGTFVNGKPVKEAYLESGDVLIFAEGGPKVSFLTSIEKDQPVVEPAPKPVNAPPPIREEFREITPPPQPPPSPRAERQSTPQKIQMPLMIQYGPTLRSFKELPVSLGSHPTCDFTLEHPGVRNRHITFFFDQGQYWVKDLTEQNLVSVNGRIIGIQAPLLPDCILALGPNGPFFRFLGAGRLAEYEEPSPE